MSLKIDGPLFGKSSACEPIIRSLPDWFGIEEAIVQYAREIDENYARTRAFYLAMGFRPLEEFTQLWNEQNPCLLMVKRI